MSPLDAWVNGITETSKSLPMLPQHKIHVLHLSPPQLLIITVCKLCPLLARLSSINVSNNKVSVATKVSVPPYFPLGGHKFVLGISMSENRISFLSSIHEIFNTHISSSRGKAYSSFSLNPRGRNNLTVAGSGEFGN